MKHIFSKSFVVLLVLAVAITACTPPAEPQAPTAAPQPTALQASPTAAATKAQPTQSNTAAPKNAVASLDEVKSAVVQIEAQGTFIDPEIGMVVNGAGRGTGFIIDPSGIAVTNNHVVTGAALLKVWVGGDKNKVYNARVLGVSECSDLAVIKIDGADFRFLQWYEGTPKVGLEVYAAGFPLGDPEYTLTKGIISKANANGNTAWAAVNSTLEHDARINPGNSGGPLVDKEGKVVGVNFATSSRLQYLAIARTEANTVLNDLKSGKDVNSIGVNGQVILDKSLNISGVWVSSVKSGSPADKSGVKAGDILFQMEGLVLGTDGSMADYCQILRSHQPTDTLSLKVVRWATQQILEGQLNGRQLAVTGNFGSGTSNNNNNPDEDTAVVTDDAGVIAMVAPIDWQYNGAAWKNTWTINGKSYPFTAQTLTVSPDVKAYNSGWNMPGIFMAVSRDWASMGGYANLLEGVASGFKECTPAGAQAYKDDIYEGQIVVYSRCGSGQTGALVMAVRPIKAPTAYLVLIEMKYTKDAELDLLDAMLATAEIGL